ncbi:MAG TPA: LysR substrate-binding domain-containing protein [Paraburkholderia sp.]|uniref:LysR substrate-binding domain-containing protein n=1 Tax=Paraburkholderia sp. TaxID=1926495 RepID=UPI002B53BD7D|nr:LysR substrate-binding domain-containing protein [Paraburkholderia sp.]HTR06516.1 LysR substrate-binding domain-containing protein [Paraburkholderia sp.]
MRKLPPLRSLQAFEAVARHRSFKDAADELNVTPTALSHQIRTLEEACGRQLFARRPRPIRLTDAGQLLYPALRRGFDSFADALFTVAEMGSTRALRITSPNAFTSRWLVPRLSLWHESHRDIPLQIIGTDAVLDLEAGEADVAIRYARSPPKGLVCKEIARDAFFPVASPGLLGTEKPCPIEAIDLLRFPLIHYEWTNGDPDAPSWSRWFSASGVPVAAFTSLRNRRDLSFREELHAIDAVLAGQGIALCSAIVLERALLSGALVTVHPFALPGYGFYVAHLAEHARSSAVRAFVQWVVCARRTEERLRFL